MALLNFIIITKLRENMYFAITEDCVKRADKELIQLVGTKEANVSMFKDGSLEYL